MPIFYNSFFKFFLCFLLIPSFLFASHIKAEGVNDNSNLSNSQLLLKLDSLVRDNRTIILNKENTINNLRNHFHNASSPLEKFNIARQIYGEYQVYDSDSALQYANIAASLLNQARIDNYDLKAHVLMDKAFAQGVQGKFDMAQETLESIDPNLLSNEMLPPFFQTKEYIFSLQSIFFDNYNEDKNNFLKSSTEVMDSITNIAEIIPTNIPWVPVALKVRLNDIGQIKHLDPQDPEFLKLKELVDSQEIPSRRAATNAYWLSCFYRNIGDKQSRIKYLAISAIYDALIANREISAIEELASVLFEDEDIDRAFNYLTYALNEVSLYKNSARIGSVSKILNLVRNAYEEDIRQRDKELHRLVVALVIVASILLILFVILYLSYRKLNSFRLKLADLNASLKKTVISRDYAIHEIQEANEKLTDSNSRNMGLLAFIIKLTNDYLGSFENFRKTLLVKFKGKKTADIESLLNNPDLFKNQYASFYRNLDKTLLSVFPDFMQEYNASAPADQQMSLDDLKKETLSTRMRIFGLKKLGIDKSAEIAQMLNISIRTVYNNR